MFKQLLDEDKSDKHHEEDTTDDGDEEATVTDDEEFGSDHQFNDDETDEDTGEQWKCGTGNRMVRYFGEVTNVSIQKEY